MAGSPPRGLFREKSLERLSSPERLDELLQLIDRRSSLPLVALFALVSGLLLWAIFSRVPVNVHGKGILIHPRTVVAIQAPGAGLLSRLDVRVGDVVAADQTLGWIAQPDLETQLGLLRQKARELTGVGRARDILRPRGTRRAGGELEGHIDESRAVALDLHRSALQSIEQERVTLVDQRERAAELTAAYERHWRKYRDLWATGLVSEQEVLAAEVVYLDSQTRLSDLETRMLDVETRRLQVDDSYLTRLRGLADLGLDLADHEQQVGDVQREIAAVEARIAEEGRISAKQRGTLREIHVAAGQFIKSGERIGTMSVGDPSSPLEALVYFTVGDGKRVRSGQTIQITPDTVERERYGGIQGVVRSVGELPVTVDEVTNQIGNHEIAAAIVGAGFRVQVLAELSPDPETPTRLAWSSSRGPEEAITAGTTTTARVAVEERRPIDFVLPAVRSTLGSD